MSIYRLSIGVCATVWLCLSVFPGPPMNTGSKQTSEVPWDVLDGGGGLMCSDNYSLGGSLDQVAPGVSVTTTRIVSAGYWAAIDTLPPCVCPCGDCNGDARITVADAIYIVAFIYRGGPGMICKCDVNLDARLTVADAIYVVAYIYRGGPTPCEPPVTMPRERQKRRAER